MIHPIYSPKLSTLAKKLNIHLHHNQALTPHDYDAILKSQYAHIPSLKQLFPFYHHQHAKKNDTLPHLINFISQHNINHCLAIGSGPSILEYTLFQHLKNLSPTPHFHLTTSDISSFWWNKYYNQITENNLSFNFQQLDIRKINISPSILNNQDLIISFGSFYIMNDTEFSNFLSSAKNAGVKYIIDFHNGHLTTLGSIKTILKKIFPILDKYKKTGQFHGYTRNTSHLKKIYKDSGFQIIGHIPTKAYTFAPILNLVSR